MRLLRYGRAVTFDPTLTRIKTATDSTGSIGKNYVGVIAQSTTTGAMTKVSRVWPPGEPGDDRSEKPGYGWRE